MNLDRRRLLRAPLLVAALASCWVAPASADDWLVYLGGGLEPIEGGWDQRQGRVIFRKVGGTLVSIPYADVDLATSAFITWQLNGRMEVPPRGPVPEADVVADGGDETPCVKGRVTALLNSETLKVRIGGETESVHIACLDAPDTRHRFAELGWFGRTTLSSIELGLRKNNEVCLAETSPPQRDREGHRVVYVTLASGKDYAAEVIAGGLGLLRLGPCERAARYRRLEDRAIAAERGLWGARGEKVAFAAAGNSIAIGAGGVGAPPPRRMGGG